MKLKSVNPYTHQVIAEFDEQSGREVKSILAHSEEAYRKWKATSFEYRKKILLKVAENLLDSSEILARTITEEMGKPKKEALEEIKKCAWVCEHFANNAEMLLHREAIATEADNAFVAFEPLGSILGIMPWNYPFWQVFRFAAPTLMAGNVVLLKHASNVQLSAVAIDNIFAKSGIPNSVFQVLRIGSGKINAIIKEDTVKAVSLTGSEKAGKKVAAQAGQCIKKTVLELGGNNPFIVLDDATIEKAVAIGIKSRMQNAGQSCIAAKRFIVHESIQEEFIQQFIEGIKHLRLSNPMDKHTDMGPLVSENQAKKVAQQVKESVRRGAEVLYGGFPEKTMYPPTLVNNVTPGMPLFDEEVFGPVAALTTFKSDEEAVALANHSKYGLGVSLFTNNLQRANKLIPKFDDGSVFINAMVHSDPRLPFGGTKSSGYGRELAVNGISEFINYKTIYIDRFKETKEKEPDQQRSVISVGL